MGFFVSWEIVMWNIQRGKCKIDLKILIQNRSNIKEKAHMRHTKSAYIMLKSVTIRGFASEFEKFL